jgi:hypothetical protein
MTGRQLGTFDPSDTEQALIPEFNSKPSRLPQVESSSPPKERAANLSSISAGPFS